MFNGVALIIAVALSIQRSPSTQWQRIKARFGRGAGSGPDGALADLPAEEVGGPAAAAGSHAGSHNH